MMTVATFSAVSALVTCVPGQGLIRIYPPPGQPAKDDVSKCVEAALKKYDEQKAVVWVSTRQEPCVYVNGKPYSVRNTEKLAKHMVLEEVNRFTVLQFYSFTFVQFYTFTVLQIKVFKFYTLLFYSCTV